MHEVTNNPSAFDYQEEVIDDALSAIEMTKPLFIIQGGRDYQVTMEDFNLWKKALDDKSNVTFKDYPELNHLLVEGEGKSTPNEYYTPHEISKEVVTDIGEWINCQE